MNRPQGIEQGFTLETPPERAGAKGAKLVLAMAVSGDLQAAMSEDGQSVVFRDAEGRRVLRYGGLHVFDSGGRVLPSGLAVRDGQVGIEVDDRAAVYPVTIDPVFTTETKLTASDAAANDTFGRSVAISGDTVVIGADLDDDGATDSGSAYVFVRTGDTWTQEQKLTASDAGIADRLGQSVAISGDMIVVGAYLDNDGGTDSGSAYVFVRSGNTWSQEQNRERCRAR
ncbi:MAG: FG-GAP repeat protein [Verrucomicrobiota bacterium]|nr:FG-GAP repeat protein [Verrucomicrobiota bacterium]